MYRPIKTQWRAVGNQTPISKRFYMYKFKKYYRDFFNPFLTT